MAVEKRSRVRGLHGIIALEDGDDLARNVVINKEMS